VAGLRRGQAHRRAGRSRGRADGDREGYRPGGTKPSTSTAKPSVALRRRGGTLWYAREGDQGSVTSREANLSTVGRGRSVWPSIPGAVPAGNGECQRECIRSNSLLAPSGKGTLSWHPTPCVPHSCWWLSCGSVSSVLSDGPPTHPGLRTRPWHSTRARAN